MAKKFSIADFMPAQNVSELVHPEIVLIPWDQIHANADNFYTVADVSDLVNSIKLHGLMDPITVTEDPAGGYVVISGHRRLKAWGELRQEDPEKYAAIPAIVRRFESPAMAELALIMANSASRVLNPAEISKQAERVERLLYDLKEQGYEFPGRMRDQVAKACQVSSSKLARLKVIRDGLRAPWTDEWDKGKLPEDTAYQLARLPDFVQEEIFVVDHNATAKGIEVVGGLLAEGGYNVDKLTGPGCSKCTHRTAFIKHDLADPWNPCKGVKCCLKCDKANRDWCPCDRMCSKAKAKRQAANAKEKEKAKAEEKEKENRLRREIRESALRLLKAADAAGVPDDTELKSASWGGKNVAYVRKAAAGEDIGSIYWNDLAPEKLDVRKVAEALHCSADYICGLTDELHPAAAETQQALQDRSGGDMQFRSGSPTERTLAWCAFVCDGTELTTVAIWWPELHGWYFEFGGQIDSECIGWYPVPDWRGVLRSDPPGKTEGGRR